MKLVQNEVTSTVSIRRMLLDDLQKLRSGELRNADARARAYVTKQIIDTMKLEAVAMQMRVETFEPLALLDAA